MDYFWGDSEMEASAVKALKEQFMLEYARKDRKGVYSLTQKMMAYNSNKIEGSTLTSEQTASLFDTGTIYASEDTVIRSKDVEEMTGHFAMFNYILMNMNKPLTEDFIKQLHYHLKTGVFEDMANGYVPGEYKKRPNIVSDIKTAMPNDVPNLMSDLLSEYNSIGKATLFDLTKFHAKYENIHPFQDGNGRTGRAILFKQCLDHYIIPVIITDETKEKYYHCLHTAQTDNSYASLNGYFEEQQMAYYEKIKCFVDIEPALQNSLVDDEGIKKCRRHL